MKENTLISLIELLQNAYQEITKAHQTLKSKIINMYRNNLFPNGSLANFYSNANGVNLMIIILFTTKIMKEQISKYGKNISNRDKSY